MMRIISAALIMLLVAAGGVFAEEARPDVEAEAQAPAPEEQVPEEGVDFGETGHETTLYVFPRIKPEIVVTPGYRFVDFSGSGAEYEYRENSLMLSGGLVMFPFPHRIFLELDFKNKKDYFADARYAYRDLVLTRFINRTLIHNLQNSKLSGSECPAGQQCVIGVNRKDVGTEYAAETNENSLFLRLKAPDYPLHVFLDGWRSEREGSMQIRSLQGSGWYTNLIRTSEKRDLDNELLKYSVGANSHLGPLEAEYSYGEKVFDAGGDQGDKALTAYYSASTFRPAGYFVHNAFSDFSESSHTVKLHTSYTGRLVASGTLAVRERRNEDSGAESDYIFGAAGLTWMPLTKLTFFLRYSHKNDDVKNPSSVRVEDARDPANFSRLYSVEKRSISYSSDTVSLTGRYRTASRLTLRAKYAFENVERENAADWNIEDSSQSHTGALSANMRLLRGLNLEAKYTFKHMVDPPYLTDPDYSDEGSLTATLTPVPRVSAYLCYCRGADNWKDSDREASRNRVSGNGTVLILKGLSFTAGYAYLYNKIVVDVDYRSGFEPDVPYKETAKVYSADIGYSPENDLSLRAGVTQTLSKAEFSPGSDDLLNPVSIASFSDLETTETVYSASGDYRLGGGFSLGVDYKFRVFDVVENVHDDNEDGDAQIIMLTASKKW